MYQTEKTYSEQPDGSKKSQFIKNKEGTDSIELTEILTERYNYQISILKDGRQITFYEDGTSFVSDTLTDRDTIYIKWLKTNGVNPISDADFGITISNFYNHDEFRYNIENHEFDKTAISYKLTFDRQRTVESVTYEPVKVINGANPEDLDEIIMGSDAETNWQFYFQPSMIGQANVFYGIKIIDIRRASNEVEQIILI